MHCKKIDVQKSVIKFLKELTSNQSHRLRLEDLSGFIIFKGCCPIISELLKTRFSILEKEHPVNEQVEQEYKLLKEIIEVVNNILCGRYVHFGVLELYRDNCFIDIFKALFEILSRLNVKEVACHISLHRTIYLLMQNFYRQCSSLVFLYLSDEVIAFSFNLLKLGFESEIPDVIICCCSIIDEMIEYIQKERSKSKSRIASRIMLILSNNAETLLHLMLMLLRITCYDEGEYIYSIFAPLYSLIMLEKKLFDEAKKALLSTEKSEIVKAKLDEELTKLVSKTEFNLDPNNKDAFLCSYTRFKTTVRTIV